MGERRGLYRVFVGKPEGKRPLGRHRRRWDKDGSPLKKRKFYKSNQDANLGVWGQT
jgi:hypothetical protein